jgi:hypothetical protein
MVEKQIACSAVTNLMELATKQWRGDLAPEKNLSSRARVGRNPLQSGRFVQLPLHL